MIIASISTQTFVIKSSIASVDLRIAFESVTLSEKILGAKYKTCVIGQMVMSKRKQGPRSFLNCLTLTLFDDKKINAKIFRNGSIQLTGCREDKHADFCAEIVYSIINSNPKSHEFKPGETEIIYWPISAMKNVNFSLGFKIDREKFGSHITNVTENFVPPLTTGYMGVKIKIPVKDPGSLSFPRVVWKTGERTIVFYRDFFASDEKRQTKKFFTSVNVFQNGKVLISGVNTETIVSAARWVKETSCAARELIEIKERAIKTFKH
jgi:TATA-box binding protein (TBP) (component of TFIID and TFIIIB)